MGITDHIWVYPAPISLFRLAMGPAPGSRGPACRAWGRCPHRTHSHSVTDPDTASSQRANQCQSSAVETGCTRARCQTLPRVLESPGKPRADLTLQAGKWSLRNSKGPLWAHSRAQAQPSVTGGLALSWGHSPGPVQLAGKPLRNPSPAGSLPWLAEQDYNPGPLTCLALVGLASSQC